MKPTSWLRSGYHFLTFFAPLAGAWAPTKATLPGDMERAPPPTAAGTMLVLRRAPGKVVFRACFPRLETKIPVRPLVRVQRPRSTQSPMGAKERAHAGVVHAQPPPRGVT